MCTELMIYRKEPFFKKIIRFQAPYRLVHIFCGQGVEKHVNNHTPERQDNCFYIMHII